MRIREIELDELAAIIELRIETWHNDQGAQELEAMGVTPISLARMIESETHKGWLCEVDGELAGFTMGVRDTGEMWVIAVRKRYENRGVGKALMRSVEVWLGSCGWKEIWLTTDVDQRLRAVGFYRHLGWTDWKIQDGDRFMRKRLDPS